MKKAEWQQGRVMGLGGAGGHFSWGGAGEGMALKAGLGAADRQQALARPGCDSVSLSITHEK